MCPKDEYNLWVPFAMEQIEEYKHDQNGLDMILNHIRILCNEQKDVGGPVSNYIIKWLAQMIQYPEQKTICPVLISKEGCGKG